MRSRWVIVAALVFSATIARADEETADDVRLRFGIGGVIGAFVEAGGNNNGGGGPGLYVRLGPQLTEELGVDVELSAGTGLFVGFARAAIQAAWTPNDRVTLAAGPSVVAFYEAGAGAGGIGGTNAESAFGLALRVDYHVHRRVRGTHRRALTLGLAIDVGLERCTSGPPDCHGIFGFAQFAADGQTMTGYAPQATVGAMLMIGTSRY